MEKCHNCGEILNLNSSIIFCSVYCQKSYKDKQNGIEKLSGSETHLEPTANEIREMVKVASIINSYLPTMNEELLLSIGVQND